MDMAQAKRKRISQLVNENFIHANVLYYFGIPFGAYQEQTLEQACLEKGLNIEQVLRELDNPQYLREAQIPLISYPLDLIIEYLKHAHYIFIKYKLPYIAHLVNDFKAQHDDFKIVERDLKMVFPMFMEDFIHHIYEEEDTLFRYIKALECASKGMHVPTRLYYLIEKYSIQKFAVEHEVHDDEMEGIRRITNNYALPSDAPLYAKVIYSELKEFEKSLITHARIENDILFPKAMALETKVKQQFFERIRLN